jgi:S1-C subfamily serine protease
MAVVKDGPAEHAEIKPGDLIYAIDGVPVLGVDDLLRLLNHERVSRDVRVSILRKGERRDRYVSPVERL